MYGANRTLLWLNRETLSAKKHLKEQHGGSVFKVVNLTDLCYSFM